MPPLMPVWVWVCVYLNCAGWILSAAHEFNAAGHAGALLFGALLLWVWRMRASPPDFPKSCLLMPGLVYSIFVRFGVSRRVAWHWVWLVPTGCFPETSWWRPFGSRRIVNVCAEDTVADLTRQSVQYVVIVPTDPGKAGDLSLQTQADWVRHLPGEVVQKIPIKLRLRDETTDCWLVKLP